MGAIAGILNADYTDVQLKPMKESLLKRGPNGIQQILMPRASLFHSIPENKQGCLDTEGFTLVWNGSLYNEDELCRDLGISGEPVDQGTVILKAYLKWKEDCVTRFNGSFTIALWDKKQEMLFLARDPMGTKPLFYSQKGNLFIFASEIKTILACPGQNAVLSSQGAMELIMLGPGRLPGSGVLEGIRELEPGCRGCFKQGKFIISRYWKLSDGVHQDSLEKTADTIRFLLEDAVKIQLAGESTFGTLLSGGLDSSILSALCAVGQGSPLRTFSVDYRDNQKNFVPGAYQPDSDDAYIQCMGQYLGSIHRKTVLTPDDLLNHLEEATAARDLPGMGDVDFSLLAFCREVRESVPTVLSGECADEIFGGYPWFRDPSFCSIPGFPWAKNTELRKTLMADPSADAEDFVLDLYEDTCRQAEILPGTCEEDRRIKELVYLNMRWFMQTLVDRNDRMSTAAGLNIKVPFCDKRIAEYVYRIPWKMKNYEGREKGLLRYAVRGLLPDRVRLRKKSPYPKTFDPAYEQIVTQKVRDLLLEDTPLWYLFSRKTTAQILEEGLNTPWYGQLMRKPQFAAWILQTDFWLKHYHINIFI